MDTIELQSKIEELDRIDLDINVEGFASFYNVAWPVVRSVLGALKDAKVTRARADRRIQAAINIGNRVMGVTSSPVKVDSARMELKTVIDDVQQVIDKIISLLTTLDKFVREETKLDNALDQTVIFLTKVNDLLERLEEKL